MGVLDKFEKSVEGAVNGVFGKIGSKDLQPVDLSRALEKEIDEQAMSVARDRTVAPNEYRFSLSTPDFDRIEKWGARRVADELAANLTKYAKTQNYAFVGPVVVVFEEDYDLQRGEFHLSSESVQGNAAPVTASNETKDCQVLELNNRQYMLTAPETLVGRGSDCDIIIDDPGVSRHHFTITITPQGVIMKECVNDKGKHPVNGTYVEGHRVPAATLLDGNTITVGRTRILYWASSETQA